MSEASSTPVMAGSSNARNIYILYLVCVVLRITTLVGVIMSYIDRGDAADWVKSHYQFQIRTFWIGMLYGVIGMILSAVLIGFLVLLFTLIWWIVRCVKGMQALEKQEPVSNPTRWMF